MIGPLDAVQDRSPRQRGAARGLADAPMRAEVAHGHRQVQFDPVAGPPVALQADVRAGDDALADRLARDGEACPGFAPGGHTQLQGEAPLAAHGQLHRSVPRVGGALFERDAAAVGEEGVH